MVINILLMKRIVYSVISIVFLTSCVKEMSTVTDDIDSFDCSIEQIENTRTQLDSYNNIRWEEEDRIILFNGSTVGECYQIAEECVGQTSGRFVKINVSDDFTSGTEVDNNIAYYPYSSVIRCAKSNSSYTLSGIALPSVQDYAQQSFAPNSFPMIAITTSVDDKQLKFRNICGVLKLQLMGSDKVRKIILKGNDNELLSGAASVGTSLNSLPVITMAENALTEVTLDCGKEGVQLGMDEATTFFFVVPPVAFKKGFSIRVVNVEGAYMEMNTTKLNTISRSTILKMPTIVFKPTGVEDKPSVDQEVFADSDGGFYEVTFLSYGNSQVEIPDDASEWIALIDTRTMTEEKIVLDIAENKTTEARSALLIVKDSCGEDIGQIVVYQTADEEIQEQMSVYVEEMGTLCNMMTEDQKNAIKKLIVTGNINALDFKTIEAMPSLKELDLSGVKVEANIIPSMAMSEIASTGSLEWYTSESNIEKMILPEGLISISEHAFNGMTSLREVYLPTTLKQIKQFAFYGTSLESVSIPASVLILEKAAFKKCESLKNVSFEEGSKLMRIESSASNDALGNTSSYGVFHSCTSLEKISIPSSVSHLGVGTFNDCTSLKEIIIPDDTKLTSLEGYYYLDPNVLGASPVTGGLVEGCWNLTDIRIPAKIKKIDQSAFMNSGLRTVAFAEGTQCSEIGDCSFSGCVYLENIDIPVTVTTMGNKVFYGCISLVSLDLTGVEVIGESVFGGCTSLKYIALPSNTEEILPSSFYNCTSLEECRIPDGLMKIGEKAFSGCTSLRNIPVSASLLEIDDSAFEKCTSLTIVRIPASVRRVGYRAFSKCTSLTEFSLDHQDEIALDGNILEFCSGLKNVNLCAKRIYVGSLFAETPLSSIEIPAEVEFWGSSRFVKDANAVIDNAYYEFGYHSGEDQWMNVINMPFYESVISSVTFESGSKLKELGTWAFAGAEYLSSLTIPETVETIGAAMFEGCSTLLEWNIPSHVKKITGPVYDASSVLFPMVESPENLEYVGPMGLMKICNSELDLSNCTYLGNCALYDCPYLSEVKWLSSGVLTLGNSITLNTPNVTEVIIPAGITSIDGNSAPFSWTAVTEVSCEPKSKLTEIGICFGSSSLKGVSNITTLDLSEAVSDSFTMKSVKGNLGGTGYRYIGVLSNMEKLSELKLPRCVGLYIDGPDSGAELRNTPNLKILEIPETVEMITCNRYGLLSESTVEEIHYLGSNIRFDGSALFAEMPSLKKVYYPNAVVTIVNSMFRDCLSLCDVHIKELDNLPSYSFYNCSSLTEFDCRLSAEIIEQDAFGGCSLSNFEIPESVNVIERGAFNCPSLRKVVFAGTESSTNEIYVENNVFNGTELSFEINRPLSSSSSSCVNSSATVESIAFNHHQVKSFMQGYTGRFKAVVSEGITSIYNGAFQRCSGLYSIQLPKTLKQICINAFADCTSLTEVIVPASAEVAGSAFYNCPANIIYE